MAVHGYVTHAAHNRRYTSLLVLGYVLAFEVIGAVALIMPLLYWDYEHTILSNPAGYAIRYALPIGVLAAMTFWWIYRGHAKAVTHALGVQLVTRRTNLASCRSPRNSAPRSACACPVSGSSRPANPMR